MRTWSITLLFVIVLSLSACNPATGPATVTATPERQDIIPSQFTPEPFTQTDALRSTSEALLQPDLAAAEAQVGYAIYALPTAASGYIFNQAIVYPETQSVCLHYLPHDPSSFTEIYLLQAPLTAPLQTRDYPGIAAVAETVAIGGASGPGTLTSGVLPPEKVCADNPEWPRYILAWQFQDRQFLLYGSVNVPAGGPGLTRLEMLHLAESLTGVATHPGDELNPDFLHSIEDAENLAGFDIKEPAYLPEGVSFLYATYQATPAPAVTLYFKIIHPEYGDKGRFFQITQAPLPETSPSALSCGEPERPECELLDLQGVPVLYQQQASGPESLDWSVDGFAFSLFRMAGEPGRVYKDELVKVVESLK